jgi:hypothetical protein
VRARGAAQRSAPIVVALPSVIVCMRTDCQLGRLAAAISRACRGKRHTSISLVLRVLLYMTCAVAARRFKTVLTLRLAPLLPIPLGAYSYVYGESASITATAAAALAAPAPASVACALPQRVSSATSPTSPALASTC